MPIKFTRQGYIEVWQGDRKLGRHTQEREAIEALSLRGPGDYRITYPEVAVRVIGTLAVGGDTEAPSVPQNVIATAVDKNQIDASWGASTDNVGATGYHVFANGIPQPDVSTGTSASITGLTPSTLYSITVAAFDASGNTSAASDAATATTPANSAPVWAAIDDQDVIVGDAFNLDLSGYATDADAEDTLTYSVASGTLPSGLSLSGSIVSGTPTTAGQTPTIVFRVDDGNDTADETVAFTSWTADVTAPPVPTGLTATPLSVSQIDLSWSASTDASGGSNQYVSGIQDYRVYRDGALRTTTTQLSFSDTGLSSATEYDYQVSARDAELNESAQSSVVSATTQSFGDPAWTTVPTVTFVQGVASNHDVVQYVSDPNSDPLTITKNAVALPTGVTFNSTLQRYEYDGVGATAGTDGHILTADDLAELDWIARSTAAGVLYATDFRSASDFLSASTSTGGRGKWGADGGPGQAAHEACVTRETTDGITGGACLRIDNPLDNRGSNAAWICSMNPAWTTKTQGMGTSAFYVQFRHKIPSSRLTQQPGTGSNSLSDGPKMINLAGYDPQDPRNGSRSNTNFEHVIQHQNWRGYPQAYRRDQNGSYPPFGEEFYSPLGTYKMQNAIDNGSSFTHADRYCLLSDPHSCFMYTVDEWVTYMIRIKVASYNGTTGNEYDLWAARPGATSWTQLYTQRNHSVGSLSDGFTGGFNGVWLLLYETNRTNPGSVATYQLWDQLIVSTQAIALPAA